jgi:L-aminopeptidase/D-esterase-like protein
VVNALGLPFATSPQRVSPAAAKAAQVPEPAPSQMPPLNTTLVVVATDAVLDKADCKRTASAAHAGLARALNPSHTLADGDTVFALATGAIALDRSTPAARQISLITLQSAAADVVRLAILDAISRAEAVTTAAGTLGAYGR